MACGAFIAGGLENLDLSISVGWAVQAGLDVELGKRTVLDFDGKYVHLTTDVKSGGTKVYDLKINPFVIGAGLGYRF